MLVWMLYACFKKQILLRYSCILRARSWVPTRERGNEVGANEVGAEESLPVSLGSAQHFCQTTHTSLRQAQGLVLAISPGETRSSWSGRYIRLG